ncbi:MAG: ferrochelatase [Chloroflexi bacterium]|nr:ferrochelatase [Chloroflexota bacterium]
MAYGTPRNLEEVEPYYRSIRGGRAPTQEEVRDLTERYRKVGGKTPMLEITQEVKERLERRLNAEGGPYHVYVGMKHWHPFVQEAVERAAAEGVERLIGLPLTPHYSEMSIGGYRSAVMDALGSLPHRFPVSFVESWYANPLFIEAIAQRILEATRGFPSADLASIEVVFSAHSLPRRIKQWNDLYPEELRRSCEAVAKAAGLASWRFTFQSAGHTREPWLGPDIMETLGLGELGKAGKQVLMVPIGFVTDNLEILFDIDVEAQELAKELGVHLRRTETLNAHSEFIEALADIVLHGTGARVVALDIQGQEP